MNINSSQAVDTRSIDQTEFVDAVRINPIQMEVIRNALDSVADEMALILIRSAYSGIVRDGMDFSTSICDAEGETLAQGLTTTLHLGAFYDAMRDLTTRYRGNVNPGDLFIFNDPYVASGGHLPDIYIVKPIFLDHALKGWATTTAHHTDVGGIVPGSNAIGARDIYGEGLRLPMLKLQERGVDVEPIREILKLNVRVPIKVLGDLRAQVAACNAAERGYLDIYKRYGVTETEAYFEELHRYAEQVSRAEISEIPDGVYRYEHYIDGIGYEPEEIVFRVALHVHGDSCTVDWEGTSPQVYAGINSPLPFTKSASYSALKSIMKSDIPNSVGFTKPIEVRAPLGSIVNPTNPGACGARGICGYRMIETLFGALAEVMPERVAADGNGGGSLIGIGGMHEGEQYVYVDTVMGNTGGMPENDGETAVAHVGANQTNIPVELVESANPVVIERYELVPDTGGPGRFRGGVSMRRDVRLLADLGVLTCRSDKRDRRPRGLDGGLPGAPAWSIMNPDGERRVLPVLVQDAEIMYRDEVFQHQIAGGGGRGNPLDRDPEMVLEDVVLEFVSREGAERDYGVVIKGEPPEIDPQATTALRAQRQSDDSTITR